MKKKIVIPVVVLAVIAIILFILSLPSQPEAEITPSPLNTKLYTILASAGIEDAVVDITDERALVRYNLPKDVNKEDALQFVVIEVAKISDSNKIIIQIYDNFTPLEEVNVDKEDALKLARHEITYEELKQRIETKSLAE